VNTAKLTALYARISTTKSTQRTDSQLHEVKQYCEARGWTNCEVFADRVSGGKASRPQLDRMVKNMREGKISRVVCFKLDRLGRSLTHLCLLVDEMSRLEIPLICCSQGIDTSGNNPAAKLQLDVLKAVCEFEKNIIIDRVNAGLNAARAKGIILGRPSTLHMRRDEVMSLRKQGMGVRSIARELKMPPASVYKIVKTEDKE
jgi:DNA invertase Pin-like site-specific DNA recombinase